MMFVALSPLNSSSLAAPMIADEYACERESERRERGSTLFKLAKKKIRLDETPKLFFFR